MPEEKDNNPSLPPPPKKKKKKKGLLTTNSFNEKSILGLLEYTPHHFKHVSCQGYSTYSYSGLKKFIILVFEVNYSCF